MASHLGLEGSCAVGANTIAEVKECTINERAAMEEDTVLGDSARTFQAGLTEWDGQMRCLWDETDTNGQVALTKGASVTLNLYPEGSGAGDTYYTGTALVEEIGVLMPGEGGYVTRDITFRGTGALTITTV